MSGVPSIVYSTYLELQYKKSWKPLIKAKRYLNTRMHNTRLASKCSPRKLLIWPPKHLILFVRLVSLIKIPLNVLKHINFGPRLFLRNFFGPPWDLSGAPLVSISSTFLRTNFSYQRRFSSFYYVHATRKSCRNDVRTKNLYVKHWWNWHLVKQNVKIRDQQLTQAVSTISLWPFDRSILIFRV